MKQILLIVATGVVFYSCNQQASTEKTDNNKVVLVEQDFNWLIGEWIRTNDKDGVQTFENWEKKSDSEYTGFGYTMQGNDTVWQERMALITLNNKWSFDAVGKDETEPTKFKLTVIEERKFICENHSNEFPKRIEYKMIGDTLHAKICGSGKEVVFNFKKKR